MRGFGSLLVIAFVLAVLPVIGLETKLAVDASLTSKSMIEWQAAKNTRDDIIRTFSEVARMCKKSKNEKMCAVYLREWESYWAKKGYTIVFGGIGYTSGLPEVVKEANPDLSNGILRPTENISSFGVLVEGHGQRVLIQRGDWGD